MQGVEVELPEAPSEPMDPSDDEPVIVSIKADGTLYIDLAGDAEQARPIEEIKSLVSKVLAQKPETPVLVWGDTAVAYGEVVELMSNLQNAGAKSVGLVTEPPSDL